MRRLLSLLLVLAVVTQATPALAREPRGVGGGTAEATYRLPDIVVTDLSLGEQQSPTITGTFTVENLGTAVLGDLRYEITLLGLPRESLKPNEPVADRAPLYDRVVSGYRLTVLPRGVKKVPFGYTPPLLPEGSYRLRVRLFTGHGQRLGWEETRVDLGDNTVSSVLLLPGPLVHADGTLAPPSGTTVPAGATFTIQGIAELLRPKEAPLEVIPRFTVFDRDVTGENLREHTSNPVTLHGGTETVIEVPVTAENRPGAYAGFLTLRDKEGNHVAPLVEYHWAVRGPAARIITAQFDQVASRRGTEAVISAGVVGPADAETTVEARVVAELLDGTHRVQRQTTSATLDAGVTLLHWPFLLPRNVKNPGLRLTLRDERGAVLDAYAFATNLTREELAEASGAARVPPFPGTALLVFLVTSAVVFLLLLRLRQRRLPWPMDTIPAILLALGALALLARVPGTEGAHPDATTSRSIRGDPETGERPRVLLSLPHPRAGMLYDSKVIPVRFEARSAAANAIPAAAEISVRYDGSGGLHLAVLRDPKELLTFRFKARECRRDTACPHPVNGFSGVLSLPQDPKLTDTTVEFDAAWWSQSLPPARPDSRDRWRLFLTLSQPPVGEVEALSCTSITGWAEDPERLGPVRVSLFLDEVEAPPGVRQLATVTADQDHTTHASRGFTFSLTPQSAPLLFDGRPHTLTVRATDPLGHSDACLPSAQTASETAGACERAPLTCQDQPPTAHLTAPVPTACRGHPTTFQGSGTDPEGERLTYRWSASPARAGVEIPADVIASDVPSAEERTATLTFASSGEYTVNFEARDGSAGQAPGQTQVNLTVLDRGGLHGQFFHDLNKNGTHEIGELYLRDRSGKATCAEELPVDGMSATYEGPTRGSARPDACIDFLPTFTAQDLCPGSYRVTATFPDGWVATTERTATVEVKPGETATVLFGGQPKERSQEPF